MSPFTKETAAEAGRRGGRSGVRKYGTEALRERGRRGGKKLVELLGSEHFREIGAKGLATRWSKPAAQSTEGT